jgi:perosamine synthetase
MSLAQVEDPALSQAFVCKRTDSVFTAIEKCLDNGLGTCLIVGDDYRPLGRISLDDIRRALLDGRALNDPSLDRHLADLAAQPARTRHNDTVVEPEVLQALLDADGRLAGVAVDRSETLVQVARPDLSHHEFRAVMDAFISTWISSKGAYVQKFEDEFGAFTDSRHAISVANGTVALHVALVALDIRPGDEVIVPDLTFAATINAVLHCGATPVIVDVDPCTWGMNLAAVRAACTVRTRAIIPVHLYGRPVEIGPIVRFAQERNIAVVEDCAEAIGARYRGRVVGQFGDVACFSFFANKIVTCGEGGMCVTNSDALARSLRVLRDHGMTPNRFYWHERVGYNYRLTNLQAAIGQAQLWRIEGTLARNRDIAAMYRDAMRGIPDVRFPPPLPDDCEPVVWLTSVQVPADKRLAIQQAAYDARIELRPFFHPLSEMPPYERFGRPCPQAQVLAATGLNLPTSRAVDEQVVERVARVFHSVLA